MKRLLLPLMITCCSHLFAQPILKWAKPSPEDFETEATCVGGDANGNIIVGHVISNPATPPFSGNNADILIQKLDANGTEVWSKQFAGIATDWCETLTVSK